MSAAVRLGLFGLLLAAIFGGAVLAGGAIDPEGARAGDAGHASPAAADGHAEPAHASGAPGEAAVSSALPGLAVAQDGYRLELTGPRPERGVRMPLSFRILDADGRPVRAFDAAHGKRMHLIVVRRDLDGFQHLHPEMAADGTWRTDVDLRDGGTYRVFADFTRDGEQHTLGSDLHVAGTFEPRAAPDPAAMARDDRGLQVRLRRDGARLSFDVLRDGRVVNDELEPYLDAKGHLVTLRTADLAYLHTHPDSGALAFETELPSAGIYRMWVQYKLDGRVHTAAFTQEEAS